MKGIWKILIATLLLAKPAIGGQTASAFVLLKPTSNNSGNDPAWAQFDKTISEFANLQMKEIHREAGVNFLPDEPPYVWILDAEGYPASTAFLCVHGETAQILLLEHRAGHEPKHLLAGFQKFIAQEIPEDQLSKEQDEDSLTIGFKDPWFAPDWPEKEQEQIRREFQQAEKALVSAPKVIVASREHLDPVVNVQDLWTARRIRWEFASGRLLSARYLITGGFSEKREIFVIDTTTGERPKVVGVAGRLEQSIVEMVQKMN